MEEMQGIMSLPQMGGEAPQPGGNSQEQALFEQLRQQVPPREFSDELLSGAMQADPQAVKEFVDELRAQSVPMDMLMLLNKMVDEILATPQDYQRIRRQYMQQGVPEDVLPAQYDPMFFAALNMALDYLTVEQPAPMGMAGGGIAGLAQYGRFGDTMLAHITPEEASLLKARGGSGTINPVTGLPEFFLGKVFKSIGKAVKKFAQSTVGRIVLPIALGFFLGPAAAGFIGVSSTAGIAAVSGFVGGAGTALLQGKNIKEALKAGAIGGVTAGATAGIMGGADAFTSTQAPAPITDLSGAPLQGPQPLVAPSGPSVDLSASAADIGASAASAPSSALPVNSLDEVARGSFSQPLNFADVPQAEVLQYRSPGMDMSQGTQMASRINPSVQPVYADQAVQAAQSPYMGSPMDPGSVAFESAAKPLPDLMQGQQAAGMSTVPGVAPPPPQSSLMDQASGLYDKAAGLYDKYMPEALGGSRGAVPAKVIEDAKTAFNAEMASSKSPFLAKQAYDAVIKAGTPGILSTYGPLAAAGVGAMALAGGFKSTPAETPNLPAFDMFNPAYAKPLQFGGLYGSRGYYVPPPPVKAATGGIMSLEMGGTTYPKKQGHIKGPGTGTSDSIPALLSDGEFVFTAKAVRNLGNGSRRKGAKRLYSMMKMLEERKV